MTFLYIFFGGKAFPALLLMSTKAQRVPLTSIHVAPVVKVTPFSFLWSQKNKI